MEPTTNDREQLTFSVQEVSVQSDLNSVCFSPPVGWIQAGQLLVLSDVVTAALSRAASVKRARMSARERETESAGLRERERESGALIYTCLMQENASNTGVNVTG